MNSSKENTSENFCGVAFITFNTIKEQEDYLYSINKDISNIAVKKNYNFKKNEMYVIEVKKD